MSVRAVTCGCLQHHSSLSSSPGVSSASGVARCIGAEIVSRGLLLAEVSFAAMLIQTGASLHTGMSHSGTWVFAIVFNPRTYTLMEGTCR